MGILTNITPFAINFHMFAIIKTGGKQYLVRPGDKIKVEKLDASLGKEVSFDALLVSDKETLLGTPNVLGYKVKAKVLSQGKGKKIIVYKYKPKKRYHKKQGHRQLYTEVEILGIAEEGGEIKSAAKKITKTSRTARITKTAAKRATSTKAKVSRSTKKSAPREKTAK